MTKYTSAMAKKELDNLADQKKTILYNESLGCKYTVKSNETPVKDESYDFAKAREQIEKINEKERKIRHARNLFNTRTKVYKDMTVDEILIYMAQLNREKSLLDNMKDIPEVRRETGSFNDEPEYTYINYDRKEVQKKYDEVSNELSEVQLALDRVNLTKTFNIDD